MSTVVDPHAPSTFGSQPGVGRVVVPVVRAGSRRSLFESAVIFVVFAVAYGLLGYWLVVTHKVTTFQALDRLSSTYLTWHGSPPKLAAIGFALPPLESIVLLPFTIISSMATSLIALPIASAIFGGATMAGVNRLLDRCDMTPPIRYPVLILFAATPTIVFYSANGDSEMVSLALLTAAMSGLVAWFRTVDTRFLISSGIAFGFAAMADYFDFAWMLLAALMIATVLSRHGADDAEVEGSVITYVAPALYAIALWCLINWLIISSPFGWLSAGGGTTVNVAPNFLGGHGPSVATAFVDALRLALNAAPLSLVIGPALLIVAIVQRNEFAGWLFAFVVLAVLRPGADALIHANVADLQIYLTPPQMLIALVGAGWLYQSFPDARLLIGGGLVVGLIASIAIIWSGMDTYPYQDAESAFHRLVTTGTTPTVARGGIQMGLGAERSMGEYIDRNVRGRTSILTDNSQTYGVILMSGRPDLFVTRLARGSAIWESDVRVPPRSIRYFLVAQNDPGDALRAAYPSAINGSRAGLTVLFKNARYALLGVAPGTTERRAGASQRAAPVAPVMVGGNGQVG